MENNGKFGKTRVGLKSSMAFTITGGIGSLKSRINSLDVSTPQFSHYINNCLLLNPKGRAIKPLTRTPNDENQLAFRCESRLFNVLFSPFYFTAENHASMTVLNKI